jgi:hypothetical protein
LSAANYLLLFDISQVSNQFILWHSPFFLL